MYRMLSEPGIDLRQPVRLEKQLLKAHVDMDTEVGASMLQLLQVQWCDCSNMVGVIAIKLLLFLGTRPSGSMLYALVWLTYILAACH